MNYPTSDWEMARLFGSAMLVLVVLCVFVYVIGYAMMHTDHHPRLTRAHRENATARECRDYVLPYRVTPGCPRTEQTFRMQDDYKGVCRCPRPGKKGVRK